ncbi:MAG: zinc ribbon domain-containing protein [Oscillospiraceae bacterium]|nr:zinc ribbon domain-containing protein [Oscillospiraceae bacterium]
MNKRTISFIAMIISALMFLCGLLVIFGAFGGNTNNASSAPYSYDSGYATFGTDFYTYVSNNAEEAASASRTAANNLDKIGSLLKSFCGIMLMGFGLLNLCRNTIVWLETKPDGTAPAQAPKASEPAPNPSECDIPYASVTPPAEEDNEPTVLFCRNCGNTLKPGQAFCGNCGTPVR